MVDRLVTRRSYSVIVTTYGEVERPTLRGLWPMSRKILKTVTRQIARIPTALIYFVADYRSAKHYLKWKVNRYRSSLNGVNRAQSDTLRTALARQVGGPIRGNPDLTVSDACYFVAPTLEEALCQSARQYNGTIVVPMFPVESDFSCGIACRMLADNCATPAISQTRVLSRLWSDPALHDLYADYLFTTLEPAIRAAAGTGSIGLILVIHGTIVAGRDGKPSRLFTGLQETNAFFNAMKQRLLTDSRNLFTDIQQGCLNHSRGGQWTAETVEHAIAGLKERQCNTVVMFPYGFFADNSETELDACNKLKEAAFQRWQYVRCINNSPAFGDWLAGKVTAAINDLDCWLDAVESLGKPAPAPHIEPGNCGRSC